MPICQTKEEQLEHAARLIWRCRGPCPVRKGVDDAQAGVFLVSSFIYKTYSAMISLQQQNLRTAGRRLHDAGPGEELRAPELLASPWGSPKDSNHVQKLKEAPSPDSQQQDGGRELRYIFSPLYPAHQSQALISTEPNVSQS